jgi:hypothetical protein
MVNSNPKERYQNIDDVIKQIDEIKKIIEK